MVALSRWEDCFRWRSISFVAASCVCSSWLNSILILMPYLLLCVRDLRRWCSELHGELRPTPDLHSRRWSLIRSKTAANQNRVQPQANANLCRVTHGLPRKVRHFNIAPFLHSHGHGGRLALAFVGLCRRGLRGRLVGLSGKIRWGKIL